MNNITKKQIGNKYTSSSATSFNNNIYILNKSIIDIFNCNLQKITTINLCEEYNSIYYNKYFYLTKKNIYNKIYVFNILLKEFDTIELKNVPENLKSNITNINIYDCMMIITTKKGIYQTTLDGYYIKRILIKNKLIKKIENCCKKIIINNYMCSAYLCGKLFVVYNEENSIYIYEISETGSVINKTYIDDNIKVNNIFIYCNKLVIYATDEDNYSYLYFTELCECNNKCSYLCKCPCNKKCCCQCKNDNNKDIINSIAHEEYKISKLIDAEANKINKVLENNPTNKDILDVNKSVNETINNITKLETVLTDKLQTIYKTKKEG